MSDKYRSGPGTLTPALFIGLGGVGSRIVDQIAGRAVRLPNWESQLQALTHFVSIDTNELDQHKLVQIPPGNRMNIAAFDKARVIEGYRRARDEQALQWLDLGYRPGYKPGAGQIRVESRLGFFFHSPEIRERLRQLVQESLRPNVTWRQSVPPKYNVYLVCTLAGGTGSGSFLPMAYLLQSVISEFNWQPRVVGNLLLSTLMLEKNAPELHPDIHANTYAALKELEHLTKLDYKQVKDEGRTAEPFVYCRDVNSPAITRVSTRPFFLAFLFDRPAHVALSDVEAAVADATYFQVFTPIMDNLAGELDNYEKNLEDLTRFPGDLKHVGQGYTKNFGACGAVAMVLPGADLLEYAARRFAAQAIRGQITFGIDPAGAGGDRARALARLAVDYSDPKFLHMGDKGRERAINQAFVESVREMARQDARQELTEGFWYQLVESIDEGRVTGTAASGERQRGESVLDRIVCKLDEGRRELLNKVSIKDRILAFPREDVNRYIEYVSLLLEDIRNARYIVDEGVRGLETAASNGEMVADLKLDPIAERYLALRLQDRLEQKAIPDAAAQLKEAQEKEVSNPKVRERLESDLYRTLQEAAGKHRLFHRDQAFMAARDEAQEYYRGVAAAARKLFDAEVRLRQLRALSEYLRRRALQYAHLAVRLDALAQDLELEAERLRRGETTQARLLAHRVEIFETLDEPRQRLWDRVYRALFLEDCAPLGVFDPPSLAAIFAREVGTGEKSVEQTTADLRRALQQLGHERLGPILFGDRDHPGIDLVRGLELEARLVLEPLKQPGEEVTVAEIDAYQEGKLKALARLADVFCRVDHHASRQFDDGVKVNRTRQIILGIGDTSSSKASEYFLERIKAALVDRGRPVKVDAGADPRLVIVHDSVLPIPLYYVEPVTRDIENSYLQLKAERRRSYPLHIDFHWEESLPNLNPRRPGFSAASTLQAFAQSLLSGILSYRPEAGVWQVYRGGETEILGSSLAVGLYRFREILSPGELAADSSSRHNQDPRQAEQRAGELEAMLEKIDSRAMRGALTRDDVLDRPLLLALLHELRPA